jgi:hypothetical protein
MRKAGIGEQQKLDVVAGEILEVFNAHDIEPGMAMNILITIATMTAVHIDCPFDEVVDLIGKSMLANKAHYYDDLREALDKKLG